MTLDDDFVLRFCLLALFSGACLCVVSELEPGFDADVGGDGIGRCSVCGGGGVAGADVSMDEMLK